MRETGRGRLATLVAGGLITLSGLLVLAALFVLSGIYNVSANRAHLDVTTWLLDLVRRQSVSTHALSVGQPPPMGVGSARLGAAHYETGCAPCHGSPAQPQSPIGTSMLPEPPKLGESIGDWSPEQLFWIVLEGQKYTGMPHWPAPERRDEVWAMVSFLRTLPRLDAEQYERWALGQTGAGASLAGMAPAGGLDTDVIAGCSRCHGAADGSPVSALVPRLAGQSAAYLERALHEYADNIRPSGIMALAVSGLDDTQLRQLARYYSDGRGAETDLEPRDAGRIERGAALFAGGSPGDDIPPCASCHSGTPRASFPSLAGQSAAYIEQQLLLWQRGLRDLSPYGAIMSRVARRLTPVQIGDVAAYLQSLPPPATGSGEEAP